MRGCAAGPEGLGFPASCGGLSATHSALLSLPSLAFWGQLWGDLVGGKFLCPELPAPSLGSSAKLESLLKMFWGAISSSAFFPCLYICLQSFPSWCQPAPLSVSLSRAPAPVPCGLARLCFPSFSLSVRENTRWVFWISVSPFSHPVLLPLLPRALLQFALCVQAGELAQGTGGQSWKPGVGFLPHWRVWPRPLQLPFPGSVDLVVLGTGVQSVTRYLLKWRPKIGTRRK